jgi:hypothetical protein
VRSALRSHGKMAFKTSESHGQPTTPPPPGARGSAARFSLTALEYQCMLYEFISLVTLSVGYFIPYPTPEVPAEKGYLNLNSPPP